MKVFISILFTLLFSISATAGPTVSIKQCAKWYKKTEKYEELKRKSRHKNWYKDKYDEIKEKMINANCPARHNEYFKI